MRVGLAVHMVASDNKFLRPYDLYSNGFDVGKARRLRIVLHARQISSPPVTHVPYCSDTTPAKQALAARLMRFCHLEPRTDHQPGFILPVTGQLYQVISNSSRRWR